MVKHQCVIQEWGVIQDPYDDDPYLAPELKGKILFGKVYGHVRIPDGHRVQTSPIINFLNEETVETMNTIYKLGKKNDDYQLFLNNYESRV